MNNKQVTINSIESSIIDLRSVTYQLECIGKLSDHVQQARFEQFITTTEETIRSLTKIKESL